MTSGGDRAVSAQAASGILSSGDDATNIQNVQGRPLTPLPAVAQVPVPSVLFNVPLRGFFVGRVDELDQLDEVMKARTGVVTQAIAGLGGIGKSTLAAEYAHRRAGDYIGTWWLTADSRANAEAGLADLARRLSPTAAVDHTDSVLSDWAVSWLQVHPGWLLVWDNVDDVEDVGALLAALSGGHHLITSRRDSGWHRINVEQPLRLGKLKADEAVKLLTRLAGPGMDAQTAEELCAELGYLPLAVEQVGAYLSESGLGGSECLAQWRTAQARAVAKAPESRPADRIMTGVWQITLDKLGDTPLAGDLLRIIAWFAPDGIPWALLAPIAEDPDSVREALRRLNAYSMISLDRGDGSVSVHRAVQAVSRAGDPDAVSTAKNMAIDILGQLIPQNGSPSVDDANKWRVLLPHIDAFASHAVGCTVSANTILVMDQAFSFLQTQGNPAAAIQIAACSLAGKEQHRGPDHTATLTSRDNLANAYESAGDPDRAIPLLEQNLAACTRILGEDHSQTLTSRNNLANAYESAGDLDRAIPLHEQNLADRVRILGEDHPDTLTSRNNLADAYESAGDLDRTIPLHEQNLAACTRILGKDHSQTLLSRNNLANAYRSAGDLDRAILLYEQNLADRIRILGKDHPDTLLSHNNLAGAYESAGDLDRAIPLYEQALAGCVQMLGENHPTTVTVRNNLADARQDNK